MKPAEEQPAPHAVSPAPNNVLGNGGGSDVRPETSDVLFEPPEPVAERGYVPPLLIAISVILLYIGDLYIMDHGADITGKAGPFPVVVYDPFKTYDELEKANPVSPEQAAKRRGQQVFNQICGQCHQGTGLGVAGQFPPLAGSEWVLTPSPGRSIRIVLNGMSGPVDVKGAAFNNAMPPWKLVLNDEQVAAVLTYIRGEWGNNAPPVTPEQVKKVRTEIQDHDAPFTASELKQVPDTDS